MGAASIRAAESASSGVWMATSMLVSTRPSMTTKIAVDIQRYVTRASLSGTWQRRATGKSG